MQEVPVNGLGLSLPRKNGVRLTDCPDVTIDVYCGRKTITHNIQIFRGSNSAVLPHFSLLNGEECLKVTICSLFLTRVRTLDKKEYLVIIRDNFC